MDSLLAFATESSWITWRDVLRLLLLSILFTAAAAVAFPDNARSRRALLVLAALALTLLPWLSSSFLGTWAIQVDRLPSFTLAHFVPAGFVLTWICVALFGLAYTGVRLAQEIMRIRALPRIDEPDLIERIDATCAQLNISRPQVRSGGSACALTLGGQFLILPAEWSGWSSNTLSAVLAHELVHIQRRDDRWLLLTRALATCYWWMPWLWLWVRKHEQAMEESCDDMASELVGRPFAYAEGLSTAAGAQNPLGTMGMHSHPLVGRIQRFAQTRTLQLDTPGVYWCVIGIVASVAVLTSFETKIRSSDRTVAAQPAVTLASSQSASFGLQAANIPEVTQRLITLPGTAPAVAQWLRHPQEQPRVVYPGSALRDQVEGDVLVEFTVNRDGSISGVQVVSAWPDTSFNRVATRAVRAIRYPSFYGSEYNINRAGQGLRADIDRPPIVAQQLIRFRLASQ